MTKAELVRLHVRIEQRLNKVANEIFDPATALDDDGTAQAERVGVITALDIVTDIFRVQLRRMNDAGRT